MKPIRTSLSLALLGAGLIASGAALGAGPLIQCEPGVAIKWPAGGANIPWNPDQGGLGALDNAGAVALTAAAFQVWADIPTATATYVQGAPLPVDVDVSNYGDYNPFGFPAPPPDGISAIVFDEDGSIFDDFFGPGSGILGFATPEYGFGPPICEVTEGVSFLNGGLGDPQALFDIMVHEFGHYSGLAHAAVNGQLVAFGDNAGPTPFDPAYGPGSLDDIETMYPFYLAGGLGGPYGTDNPALDDIVSLSALYPDPSFAATTANVTGTMLASDGTTPITGVNIIARNEANPFADAVSVLSGDYDIPGIYTLFGLTPGADYRVYTDQILGGGFSTSPASPFPGAEEYYNGAAESNNVDSPDPVTDFEFVAAGDTGVDFIVNIPGPGDPLPLGDEGFIEVQLPFDYQLCGQNFDSVFINANGSLTFGGAIGFGDFANSVGNFLGGFPRVAPFWTDLDQSAGGMIAYYPSKNSFRVEWTNVPEFLFGGANTFSVTLNKASGTVDFEYGDLSTEFWSRLAGISCGGDVTSGFEEASDLSQLADDADGDRINAKNQTALYETWGLLVPSDLADSELLFNGTSEFNDDWAEPNDTLKKARSISLPFDSIDPNRYTEIEPTGGDVDFYRFSTQGLNFLQIEILSGNLDSYIGLFDSSGSLVAANDDGGAGLLSKLELGGLPAGDYTVGVTTFSDPDFSGDGFSGGRYVLSILEAETLVIPLALGDDSSAEVPLAFDFPFNGSNYSSVFVNSNGNLTFGSGDGDFSPSVAEFLNDQPRIAPLWDDLSPNNGGSVVAEVGVDFLTVTFDAVPEFPATGANSFTVTLNPDGSFDFAYGAMSSTTGITGATEGGGAADPGPSDMAGGSFPAAGTTYEEDPADLSGSTIDFN